MQYRRWPVFFYIKPCAMSGAASYKTRRCVHDVMSNSRRRRPFIDLSRHKGRLIEASTLIYVASKLFLTLPKVPSKWHLAYFPRRLLSSEKLQSFQTVVMISDERRVSPHSHRHVSRPMSPNDMYTRWRYINCFPSSTARSPPVVSCSTCLAYNPLIDT